MKFSKLVVLGSLMAACGQAPEEDFVDSVYTDAGVELGVSEQALTSRQGQKRQFGANRLVGSSPLCQVDVPSQTCVVPSKNKLEFAVTSSQWDSDELAQFTVALDTLNADLAPGDWHFRLVASGSPKDPNYLRIEVKTGNATDTNNRFDVEDFHTVIWSTLDVTEGQTGRMPSGNYTRHIGGTCVIDTKDLRVKVLDDLNYPNPISAYYWWVRHVFGNCAAAFIGLGADTNNVTRSYSQMLPPPVTNWRFPFATTRTERCLANSFNPSNQTDYSVVSYICN